MSELAICVRPRESRRRVRGASGRVRGASVASAVQAVASAAQAARQRRERARPRRKPARPKCLTLVHMYDSAKWTPSDLKNKTSDLDFT